MSTSKSTKSTSSTLPNFSNSADSIQGQSLLYSRWDRKRSIAPTPPLNPKYSTQQQFAAECDMNNIVANANRGIPPKYSARGTPQYGDFSEIPSLVESYDLIRRAEEAFMDLPAHLRLELNNDPSNIGKLTREQAERYKLLKEPTPSPASPTPPAVQAEPVSPPKLEQKAQP